MASSRTHAEVKCEGKIKKKKNGLKKTFALHLITESVEERQRKKPKIKLMKKHLADNWKNFFLKQK